MIDAITCSLVDISETDALVSKAGYASLVSVSISVAVVRILFMLFADNFRISVRFGLALEHYREPFSPLIPINCRYLNPIADKDMYKSLQFQVSIIEFQMFVDEFGIYVIQINV